jgi:hypothetical protein
MARTLPTRPFFNVSLTAALLALAVAPTARAAEAGSTDTPLPEAVTFSEHVAPIFYEHCVTCHRPKDVAPMSLLTYESARPWAKSIAKAVVDREMPPWDADPRYGDFSNDTSLDDREVALVMRWVEQGAPEGDRAKLPPEPVLPAPGSWKMGRQPDYVIDLAEIAVPAAGPDIFVTQIFGSDIPAGKWVQAMELLPGNTDVLHHVVTYLGPFGMGDDDNDAAATSGILKTIFLNDAAKREVGMAEAPRIGGVWSRAARLRRSPPVTANRWPPASCSRSTCTTTRAAPPAPTARSWASTSARVRSRRRSPPPSPPIPGSSSRPANPTIARMPSTSSRATP